jgi:hypothetical protein
LLLAGSVLKPTGQTLLVGDHRQLATVTEMDWEETLRKPLTETNAYRSALTYIQWLNTTGTPAGQIPPATGDDGTQQTLLSGFDNTDERPQTEGDRR